MIKKSILSLLLLLIFAILGAGSIDDDGNLEGWFWALIIGFVFICIMSVIMGNEAEKEKRQKQQQRAELKQKEREAKMEEYNAARQQFLAANGTPDKSIIIEELNLDAEIHAYESSKKVFILGKEYDFKDIISCTFSDSPRVIKGKVTAVTKTGTGSVIGRSVVGDVIAGPAGAIIGGATAKKNTEFIQENDQTIHDYTVIININSISEPIIRIRTGRDGKLTNEIVGLMNVIITRK